MRLTDGGYGPRYSPDGKSILFWNRDGLWTTEATATGAPQRVYDGLASPAIGVWSNKGPAIVIDNQIRSTSQELLFSPGRMIWPRFDVLPDGRWVIAPIDIRETGLWAVDLTYKER